MRNTLLMLALCVTMISCQFTKRVLATEEQTQYSTVINVEGSKDDLYTRANEWMVLQFVDADAVIQYQDKESGKIMGKYVGKYNQLDIMTAAESYNSYKVVISIDVRDGAARLQFMSPMYYSTKERKYYPVRYANTAKQIYADWEALSADLSAYLGKKDEW